MHTLRSLPCTLGVLIALLTACEESEGEDIGMDGGDPDAALDGGGDGGSLDGGDAAASDAGPMDGGHSDGGCFSPIKPPSKFQNVAVQGCSCGESVANSVGYCVEGKPIVCGGEGRWQHVYGGPCVPRANDGVVAGWCAQAGGFVPQDGETCPGGFHQQSVSPSSTDADAGADGTGCCIPLSASQSECTQAGYHTSGFASEADRRAGRCSDGTALRGFIISTVANPLLCCE
jgi:hypothetical protein